MLLIYHLQQLFSLHPVVFLLLIVNCFKYVFVIEATSLSLITSLSTFITTVFSDGFFTVTLQVYFLLPTFAVITAVPLFFAVTFPFFTVATLLLLVFQFAFFFVPDTFNTVLCPTYTVTLDLLIFAARQQWMLVLRISKAVALQEL